MGEFPHTPHLNPPLYAGDFKKWEAKNLYFLLFIVGHWILWELPGFKYLGTPNFFSSPGKPSPRWLSFFNLETPNLNQGVGKVAEQYSKLGLKHACLFNPGGSRSSRLSFGPRGWC